MLPLHIIITALTAQFIYILVNWYFFRRKEYVYYSMYVMILTGYFLNKYMGDENSIIHIGPVGLSILYPDRILAVLSYIFYFKFGRHFVETKTRYPAFDKLMVITEKILFTYICFDLLMLALFGYADWQNLVFIPVNLSIFVVLIIVFRTMIIKNEMLDRFILTGSMFFAVSAFITLWMGMGKEPLDNSHIIALQIGALVEMIFLNAGLVYKSRMLQEKMLISQNQLIERYEENQSLMMRLGNIRERISRDLHDDVGATLSSIKAYSEVLKTNPNNPVIAELINSNSSEMIESLEMIAWATNPAYDQFSGLKNMIRRFATPICRAQKINFNIDSTNVPDELPMHGETRQHLLLIAKESINNSIKYSGADICHVNISITDNQFIMTISDNGKGLDGEIKGKGHGMANMRKRAEELQGNMAIESLPGAGTTMIIQIPFPFKIPDSWDMPAY